jgi:hypothetical protein
MPSSYLFQRISGHCFLFCWIVCDVNVGYFCRLDARMLWELLCKGICEEVGIITPILQNFNYNTIS